MLEFPGQQQLPLCRILQCGRGFMLCGDVTRNRKQMRGLSIVAEDRRDLHVPISRRADRGIGRALKAGGAAGNRGRHRRLGFGIALTSPEIRPRTALQLAEILDLHDALTAFAHELKAAVEIEDLDAIAASGQDAAQNVGVTRQASASRSQLAIQRGDSRSLDCRYHETTPRLSSLSAMRGKARAADRFNFTEAYVGTPAGSTP